MDRPDDPHAVMLHADAFHGGRALICLGGYSLARWQEIREEIKPDVLIGCNGVNAIVRGLDYWMICENMKLQNKWATVNHDPRGIAMMEMFHRAAGAKVKLVSHRSWSLLRDTTNCVRTRRTGYELEEIPASFSFRDYGEGFLNGGISKHREAWQPRVVTRAGTVGLQALHMAGILGVGEAHTIGFDLVFREKDRHHGYPYPPYIADKFRTPQMFLEYKGVQTQHIWIETAEYLKGIEPLLERDGLRWVDHSDGLLKLEGLKCTQGETMR